MEVQDAIEAPRVASYSFPSSFAPFEYFPGRLAVEGRIDPATRADLAARGHEVKDWPDWTWLAGSVEAILTDPATGLIGGGRRSAAAGLRDRDLRRQPTPEFCVGWRAQRRIRWPMHFSHRLGRAGLLRSPQMTPVADLLS